MSWGKVQWDVYSTMLSNIYYGFRQVAFKAPRASQPSLANLAKGLAFLVRYHPSNHLSMLTNSMFVTVRASIYMSSKWLTSYEGNEFLEIYNGTESR
jgi:hypothetical protein